nr:unnamed protein product [Callosobruchus analis]
MALNQDEAKQVVRVDQDSETDLQALFDSVLKPDSKRPLQVPWSMRKLPDSFFNPPSTGSKSINHSRENSVDSAFGVAVVPRLPPLTRFPCRLRTTEPTARRLHYSKLSLLVNNKPQSTNISNRGLTTWPPNLRTTHPYRLAGNKPEPPKDRCTT